MYVYLSICLFLLVASWWHRTQKYQCCACIDAKMDGKIIWLVFSPIASSSSAPQQFGSWHKVANVQTKQAIDEFLRCEVHGLG